jgi:cell division FtsZ-interacting protein ZapD
VCRFVISFFSSVRSRLTVPCGACSQTLASAVPVQKAVVF